MQREEDGQRRGDDHVCAGWGLDLSAKSHCGLYGCMTAVLCA